MLFEELYLDLVGMTKDERKGEKEAIKALKKQNSITNSYIEKLTDKVYKQTSNSYYLDGYMNIIRQVNAQLKNNIAVA